MIKNFSIPDSVTLQINERVFDLHNDFNVYAVSKNFQENVLEVTFASTVEGIKPQERITVTFHEIDALLLSSNALNLAEPDLMEMGYKNPEDFDHDWINRESVSTSEDHLFFRLCGDEFIRLHSKSATARVCSPGKIQ
ncbi:hypothetical protein HX882_32175 [Pseudomonas gingeri]|uniref:Uncharacterized protein n=1 Tax=Pseudomonas gingeri TaxID=117681 RepID=A0A7Y7XIK8_9PSED|nr:hypothetical protein [Pseudomonas gingeri]NWC00539.1 hypothetical protein [Pseudomonas gingeri]